MSAAEIVASLGVEVDAELVVELDEHLAAADEVAALEEDAPKAFTKLGLVGLLGKIYAKFSPGPSGSGPCNKKGTGGFTSSKPASGLSGKYKLKVSTLTCKLYDQAGKLVWSGIGAQKGLSGTWDVTF